jgi:hypothetical protein
MAEVGENAADGGRHVRFEVSEDLSRGGAPTVLNRAGEAAAGVGAGGGTGEVATGGTGTGARGNPETRLGRTPPEDHVMGEAESGDPIELLKKELADTRAELMSLRMGSVAIHLAMVSPAGERWYARANIFFKAYEEISQWNELRMQRVQGEKVHDLVLLRWYKKKGLDRRGRMRDSRMGLGCGEAVDIGRGHIIGTIRRDGTTKNNTNSRQRTLV